MIKKKFANEYQSDNKTMLDFGKKQIVALAIGICICALLAYYLKDKMSLDALLAICAVVLLIDFLFFVNQKQGRSYGTFLIEMLFYKPPIYKYSYVDILSDEYVADFALSADEKLEIEKEKSIQKMYDDIYNFDDV